jgi:hypothetical protein
MGVDLAEGAFGDPVAHVGGDELAHRNDARLEQRPRQLVGLEGGVEEIRMKAGSRAPRSSTAQVIPPKTARSSRRRAGSTSASITEGASILRSMIAE